MTVELTITLGALVVAVAGTGYLVWLERKPRVPGHPRLIPSTPLMFLCLLVMIVAIAHLLTIVTGTPHTGRFG